MPSRRRFSRLFVTRPGNATYWPRSTNGRQHMSDQRISDLFRIRSRYTRSVNLERDFEDRTTLKGYVVTPHIQDCLKRLSASLIPNSSQRAWRVTGDYGSGKSSFALAFAHLSSGRRNGIRPFDWERKRSARHSRRIGQVSRIRHTESRTTGRFLSPVYALTHSSCYRSTIVASTEYYRNPEVNDGKNGKI